MGEASEGKIHMGVGDTGPGIPESEIENVIARFYRLDKARHSEGAGLDLALVNAITVFHQGELLLSSNTPGLRATVLWPQTNKKP